MPIAELGNISLYYEVRGRGPKLLFISGTGGDLRNRPNLFDGPLPGHYQVLGFDQRGLGQSDKPEREYAMADYADDVAALLEHLQWPAVPVVGVSFGGMVAQELALRYPQRVSRMVLCCTSSGGEGGASFPLHELAELAAEDRAARHLAQSDLRRDAAWREANDERWQKLLQMTLDAQRPDRDEAGAARQLAARAGHNTWQRLPQLDLPVLIMGGRYDGIAPVSNQEALAAQVPQAEMRLYEGGHLFLAQDKTAYPELLTWLGASVS